MISGVKYAFAVLMVVFSSFWVSAKWSTTDFPWDAISSLIVTLAALAGVIYQDQKKYADLKGESTPLCEHDFNLINQFLEIFPSEETTSFFRDHDFSNSFRDSRTKGLFYFVDYWDVVDKKFIDIELEQRRSDFYLFAKDVARNIAQYTSPKGIDFQSVDPNGRNSDFYPDPLIEQEIKILNAVASAFFEKYEVFINYCLCRKSIGK